MVDRWEAEHDVATRFRSVNGARPLPPRVETAFYRICQEALTNVARHAEASRVTVRLVVTPEQIQLVVEDDGRGFEGSKTPEEHHGLLGMRERAEMVDGSLDVGSSPGAGTRIEVSAPLEKL